MYQHKKTTNHYRSWSRQEIAILRTEFMKQTSIPEIAHKLRRNDDAVVYRLIKIGMLGYPEEKDGENHGKSWEEREKNLLLKEYKEGKSIEEMARLHGRAQNAILFQLIHCRAFDYTVRAELEKHIHHDSLTIVGFSDKDTQRIGGEKMGFERIAFNTTKIIPSKGNNLFTGRPDAIFIRNKFQQELDNSWASVVNMVHYIEEESQKLRDSFGKAQKLKQDIKAHETERADLYDSLGNLLSKETSFEDKMWQTTQQGRKVTSITVKQKFKDSDVGEQHFDSMMEYIKQYPEYASKSSFKKVLDRIDQKEAEIRETKKTYNGAVSTYNYYLSFFDKHILKAEDKIVEYEKLLQEGEEKLSNCRYRKSIFYKMASEETRAEVNIDTMNHRLDQFKHTLNLLKEELTQTQKRTFNEMEF